MIPLSHPVIGLKEREAVDRVLRSGVLAAGPEVEAFEVEFAEAHKVGHSIAVSNGTVALHLALWALGIGAGDEVILPSFTFAATANAIELCGATPVFAEIDPRTFCLSAHTVEPQLSKRTVAVIQVHLYGQPADMDAMTALCRRNSIALVEDAAQAHGAAWNGTPVGGLGDVGTFSFYPTKNMTTGEGGMVTTNSVETAAKLRLLRNHGMKRRYRHDIIGTNGRMTDIAAAIGRVQLSQLPTWNQKRQSNAEFYDDRLAGCVATPSVEPEATHVYHQYTVTCTDRVAMIAALKASGIASPRPAPSTRP